MGKNAIISVFDKTNLDVIANFLIKKRFTIYSTGGTSKYLKKINIPHIEISKYTKQKEILDGRVKTLDPKIFGGLLGTDSNKHQIELRNEGIVNFDALIVNLYPFEETLNSTKDNSKIIRASSISYKPGIKPIPKDAKANLLTHFHPCFLIILFSSFSIICNNSSFSYS